MWSRPKSSSISQKGLVVLQAVAVERAAVEETVVLQAVAVERAAVEETVVL
jgi:hypothetical protein